VLKGTGTRTVTGVSRRSTCRCRSAGTCASGTGAGK